MKLALLRFYQSLDQNIDLKKSGTAILWIFSSLISIYCIILLCLPLYRTSAPKGIVFANDNDGGRAIEISMKTRWYNSNSFAAYGNLYYRLSQTLADLVPLPEQGLAQIDQKEKTHGFSLKLISLLALYSLGLGITYLLIGFTPASLLFSSFFTLWCLRIPMWTHWIFRPHPEHLLILCTALAVYLFAKFLAKPEDRKIFILSAMAWGLAMAVKRSTATFVPGILIFLIFPYKKEKLLEALKYVGFMLLAYLLVGFPQNFGFYKHVKFLLYESSLHSVADIATFVKGISITWDQLWVLLIPVLTLSVFSDRQEKNFSWKLVLFVLISTLPIFMRKLAFPGDHHTMPLAVTFLVLILIAVLHFNPWRIVSRRELILFPLALVLLKFHGIPETYAVMEKEQMVCRSEMLNINDLVSKKITKDFQILKEPFFPSNSSIDVFAKTEWGIQFNSIKDTTGFIGIFHPSYRDYSTTPPSHFYGRMIEDFASKSQFYNALKNNDQFTHAGNTFKKVFTGCNYELWEKE